MLHFYATFKAQRSCNVYKLFLGRLSSFSQRRPFPDFDQRFPSFVSKNIPNVKRTVAVYSAKGGVGKSTVAANLAVSYALKGWNVGLVDCDIYGPSIPTLMGTENLEANVDKQNRILPLQSHGVKSISMGNLTASEGAFAWRGLMATKALEQLLFQVYWSNLDVLILDLPPGTGDVQLTVAQKIKLDGVVAVSTPQKMALKDTMRGIRLFEKLNVYIIGLVQNMSYIVCGNCHQRHYVFGQHSMQGLISTLGELPIDQEISNFSDAGRPICMFQKTLPSAKAFMQIADNVCKIIDSRSNC